MENQYGIDELLELIDGVIDTKKMYEKVMADGKLTLTDIQYLPAFFGSAYQAIEGSNLIIPQYLDLDEKECEAVKNHFKTNFELENDGLEAFIEDFFNVLIEMKKHINLLGKLLGKIKGSDLD